VQLEAGLMEELVMALLRYESAWVAASCRAYTHLSDADANAALTKVLPRVRHEVGVRQFGAVAPLSQPVRVTGNEGKPALFTLDGQLW
jgi:hypothetical protein